MLELGDNNYIAQGDNRICYQHPNDKNLCVKVDKNQQEMDSYQEVKYYKKLEKKDFSNFDYQFFSKYYGQTETNLGIGFIYDLILDETTQVISNTLQYCLDAGTIENSTLASAINRLKQQMIKHRVFVSNLYPKNICCKILSDHSIELILVDALGHRDFFPLIEYFQTLAEKKVNRHFVRSGLSLISA